MTKWNDAKTSCPEVGVDVIAELESGELVIARTIIMWHADMQTYSPIKNWIYLECVNKTPC